MMLRLLTGGVIAAFALASSACTAPTTEETQGQSGPSLLLWQTNSDGDDIHVFNVETGALVRRLAVGPHPHGIASTADHRTVFVTLEANGRPRGELLWIDARSFAVTRRMEICREPHALGVTPDGRWLYVPCRDGHYWVVDGTSGDVAVRIRTGGRPHNTQISSDGKWAFLSPMGAPHAVTIVDIAAGHRVVGRIAFANSVRPSALSADGRWFVQHVDGLNGFQAADVQAREVVATAMHETPLDGLVPIGSLGRLGFGGLSRCHGLAIRPDQREIWSVCGDTLSIHAFRPPDFPEIAHMYLPHKGYWMTFSPDSRLAFVALADAGEVAVIDSGTRAIAQKIAAGPAPKRNLALQPVAD